MPKLHVELDGPRFPASAAVIQDGTPRFDLAQLQLMLDAPTGQNFITQTTVLPDGEARATFHKITSATLTIHYSQEA